MTEHSEYFFLKVQKDYGRNRAILCLVFVSTVLYDIHKTSYHLKFQNLVCCSVDFSNLSCGSKATKDMNCHSRRSSTSVLKFHLVELQVVFEQRLILDKIFTSLLLLKIISKHKQSSRVVNLARQKQNSWQKQDFC